MLPLKDTAKASMTSLVKRIINKGSETKMISRIVENNVLHNSAMSAADVVPILPQIQQGTDDGRRIGDSVKPISLRVSGVISMNRNATDTNKVLLVRVLIVASKLAKNPNAFGSLTVSTMFKPNYGGPSQQSFDGNLSDLSMPVNTDSYRVYYDKVHRIAPCGNERGTEENPASFKRWTATVSLPASLLYDDAVSTADPTNFAPFLLTGYAYADGTGPDVLATRILTCTTSCLKYKDF